VNGTELETFSRTGRASLAVGASLALLGLSALLMGCAKQCSGLDTEPRTRAAPVKPATAAPGRPEGAAPAGGEKHVEDGGATFAGAIRRRSFTEAARLIDAAPREERLEPEVRYVRALVALELLDPNRALAEVSGLAQAAPAFASRADQVALRVAKQTRDAVVLEHLLSQAARQGASDDRLLLAEALLESGQVKQGEATLDDILRTLEQEKSPNLDLMIRTRRARALLRQQLGRAREGAADFRWLAINAVGTVAAERADQHAEHLDPQKLLTKSERLARARRLSELGAIESVAEELRRLARAPGQPPEPQAETFIRGWAVYASRSDYPAAAGLFAKAALETGAERAKCLYYQAKALARSGEHERAIVIYRQVGTLGGSYVEPANYEVARLLHLGGDWQAAISSYERYLRQFPNGAHRSSVEGDLPVVRLAIGAHVPARRELAKLIAKTDDARERARLLELEGVAAAGSGDSKTAAALFAKVIEEQPLTLPALLAQNRLRAMGSPLPPLLPPRRTVPSAPPLPRLRLPDLVERLHRVGLDEEAEAALKAEEPALRVRFGERTPEVLCRLYGQLASAMRRYQIAQTASKRESLFQEPTGDGLWQWECIYPRPYAEVVERETSSRHISASFAYAVMRQESAFRPTVVSSAQAVGLMQIIPTTAARIAQEIGTPYDPELMRAPAINVTFGVYYLAKLTRMYGGRPELAAAAYNAGPRALSGWLKSLAVLPADLFIASIPYEETRTYVYRVMSNYARYAYLAGEPLPNVPLELPSGLSAPPDAY
jgi:soluble lytic murein transglycosylase